jgi:hypothetical protein
MESEQDGAAPGGLHGGQGQVDALQGRRHVHLEILVQGLRGKGAGGPGGAAGGVVDQHLGGAAVIGDDALEGGLQGDGVDHIRHLDEGHGGTGLGQGGLEGGAVGFLLDHQAHGEALPGEAPGYGQADAGTGSDDEGEGQGHGGSGGVRIQAIIGEDMVVF